MLNGPNLNLLGTREPSIYGVLPLESIAQMVENVYQNVKLLQTNSEAEMVEWVHNIFKAGSDAAIGVIINPGAFTHYSYALRDALAMLREAGIKCIEVHLSNPAAREEFRHTSVISECVTGTVSGLGAKGYVLAAKYLVESDGNAQNTRGEEASGTK